MSHYQSKGDRSEAQLKKAGKFSGPGHQRSGAPSPAVKGGGAGGPSPSGGAPPAPAASLTGSQSIAAAPPARPTTPASSTPRGGKRANGPVGPGKGGASGAPTEHGSNYKAPQYPGPQYQNAPSQQQGNAAMARQGMGSSDANLHLATNSGLQSELKQTSQLAFQALSSAAGSRAPLPGSIVGGAPAPIPKQSYTGGASMAPGPAARPPAPSMPAASVSGSESISPVATAASSVDMARASLQAPFSFQFGSISPGFMQIPARTSSAPPNLDEQRREQARFEASRGAVANKVPTVPSGPQQGQVTRGSGSAGEHPQPVLQHNQSTITQGLSSGAVGSQPANQSTSLTQAPVQFSQAQGQVHSVPLQGHGPQIPQVTVHMSTPLQLPSQQLHIQIVAAQAQAQQAQAQAQAQAHAQAHAHQPQAHQAQAHAHAQQQALAQQALPQQSLPQQGMVQQNIGQSMKFPPSMMAPPHGAQMIPQQMGNPMAGQLSAQQVPPQMAHQLGPQMGGAMGGQLPPGIPGTQYGPHAGGQYIQPQKSRPVKIVHPETHEELRFDAKTKKGESYIMDAGPLASAAVSSGLPVRVSSNGLPQPRAPVNYGSGHHTMVSSMNYYQPSYAPPAFYQSVPPKSGVNAAGPPPPNTPPVRYYGPPQTPTFLNPTGSKVGSSGGVGLGLDVPSTASSAPSVMSPMGGPPPLQPPVVIQAIPQVPPRIVPPPVSQLGSIASPSSNGRATGSLASPSGSSSSVPVTPSSNTLVDFKFGDVEASGSAAHMSSSEASSDNVSIAQSPLSHTNGATAVDSSAQNQSAQASASELASSRKETVKVATVPVTSSPKPTISVPASKPVSAPPSTSATSPRVIPVSSGSAGHGEKHRAEGTKPTTITRENSRKSTKKEKQLRLQQQQQQLQQPSITPLASTIALGDGEAERKGEATSTASSVTVNSQFTTEKGSLASPKVALQRSHSGLQSNSGPPASSKVSTSSRSEDSKGTNKISVDSEKRASGKASSLSSQHSELIAQSTAITSSEGAQRSISKQGSGKVLAPSKILDEKDGLATETYSSLKGGVGPKLSISPSKAPSVASGVREANVGLVAEASPMKGQVAKDLLSIDVKDDKDVGMSENPTVPAQSPGSQSLEKESEVVVAGRNSNSALTEPSTILPNEHEECTSVKDLSNPENVDDSKTVSEVSELSSLVSKDSVAATELEMSDAAVVKVVSEIPVEASLGDEKPSAKDLVVGSVHCSNQDAAQTEVLTSVDRELNEERACISEIAPESVGIKLEASMPDLDVLALETQSELGSEEISVTKVAGDEVEVSTDVPSNSSVGADGLESGLLKGIDDQTASPEVLLSSEPQKVKYKPNVSVNVDNLLEASDSPSFNNPSSDGEVQSAMEKVQIGQFNNDESIASLGAQLTVEMQAETSGSSEDRNVREESDSLNAAGANSIVEVDSSLNSSVPEPKMGGSKKKKKKELYAKADAIGPIVDLFTAYKASEDKKVDEFKRADAPGSSNLGSDMKKDLVSSLEKPVVKELDDWEDAAELPTPKSTLGAVGSSSGLNIVTGEVHNPSAFGVKKYTRDFLLTQQNLNRDLPSQFEIRADLAESLLTAQAMAISFADRDSLPSPGPGLERQSSAGRLDRRNSNVGSEDDRWTRQPGSVSSPGRVAPDGRMDLSMVGPPGGFRPGQGRNAGLMGMPPGMRPGMGPQGIMPMGGLLPGGPLLPPHMMMSSAPGRPMNVAGGSGGASGGVDADRWQRAPPGQKGLIPSPRTPLPAIHKTENRYQVGKTSDEEQQKQRQIKGILNKLTPQNFDKLFAQVKEVHIDSATTLTGVISQIFDKALTEPTFCEMYAKFCVQLAVELPEFTEDNEKITFKRVLLNKCQEEFERGEREQQEAEKIEEDGEVKLSPEEREEKRTKARRRMLGNIRFIGELYKKNMLTERIMHECIKKLLGEYQNPDEEDVEALCKLMSTIGRIIDHAKAKEHIDAYFKRMEKLSENLKLSSRLRFMLKDGIDLRRNGWQERRKVEGPKKIDEVHRDAVQERQAAAASGRDRLQQQRASFAPGGGRRPVNEYAMRGSQPPMFPSGAQMGGGMPMGGLRGPQPPPGGMRGGFVQDVRMEDRLLMDTRPVPMPLSQRPSDDGSLTLGPQGGLGRVMSSRGPQPVPGRSVLADVSPMSFGESRRPGMGPVPGFGPGMISERSSFGGRDDMSMRGPVAERPLGSVDRPLLERPLGPERLGPTGPGRDMRGPDRSLERPRTPVGLSGSVRPLTPPAPVAARLSPVVPLPLSEEELKKKSLSTIIEFYSVRDIKEAAQCVDELKSPKFHPVMVSTWVSHALEGKDNERDYLIKLIVHLHNTEPPLLTNDHINKGLESVLSMLQETIVDVPRAPDHVSAMFAKLICAGIFSLTQVGKLFKEGGMDPGSLLEDGVALVMFGSVLDILRKEKGEAWMIDMYRTSGHHLEDFVPPDNKRNGSYFESFLGKKNLQCLYPMIPLEKYLQEALDNDEPVPEILKWIENNVPQTTYSEHAFLRMIMTQVLRHSIPVESGKLAPHFEKSLDGKIKKYAGLLRKFATGRPKMAEANQRQYIVAVQLFVHDLGHPPRLISALFHDLYEEEVIFEQSFIRWQDDVHDATPGRDKAIKDSYNWFRWLDEAPEEGGDEED